VFRGVLIVQYNVGCHVSDTGLRVRENYCKTIDSATNQYLKQC
jgi:hypothetical protein